MRDKGVIMKRKYYSLVIFLVIEGLLGCPFFNNYVVCFDFKHKLVGLKEIKQVKRK